MTMRKERLAVSLADLDRIPSELRGPLIAGRVDTGTPITVEKNTTTREAALVFTCDLLAAAAVCDVLRGFDRASGDAPTGLYMSSGGPWSRVKVDTVLTVLTDGAVELNPAVFPVAAVAGKPPPVAALKIGRNICRT